MTEANNRKFLENVFAQYVKGDIDHFFDHFDPNINWTTHGSTVISGVFKGLRAVKDAYGSYYQLLRGSPKPKVRYILLDGDKAAVFLYDEVIGKDGKEYTVDYFLILQLSKDGKKIASVENFLDSLQMQKLEKASERMRLSA